MTNSNCKNCGADKGLHHCQTMQCPVGGREASINQKQEWMTTTFETESDNMSREEIKKIIREYIVQNLKVYVDSSNGKLSVKLKLEDVEIDRDADWIK